MNNYCISLIACAKRALLAITLFIAPLANAQEVIVMSGFDEITRWMKSENWWGEGGPIAEAPHPVEVSLPESLPAPGLLPVIHYVDSDMLSSLHV